MQVQFESDGRKPYVIELYNLDVNEGVIDFNGYYYEDEEDLPKKVTMFYKNDTTTNNKYEIQIYKMDVYENTSKYFDDEDFGPICLYPTYKMKLYFTVLN